MADRKSTESDGSDAPEVSEDGNGPAETSAGTDAATDAETNDTADTAGDEATQDTADDTSEDGTDSGSSVTDMIPGTSSSDESNSSKSSSGSGFVPALLGGIIAAGIGFVAALILMPTLDQGTSQDVLDQLDGLGSRLDTVEDDVSSTASALEQQISEAVSSVEEQVESGPSSDVIDELRQTYDQALSDLTAQVEDIQSGIDERLSAVEETVSSPLSAEEARQTLMENFQDEIDSVLSETRERIDAAEQAATEARNEMQAVRQETAERQAQVEAERVRAIQETVVAEVRSAIESGAGFAEPLSRLSDMEVSPPDSLSQVADDGVPTLSTLQNGWTPAARDALTAAPGSGLGEEGSLFQRIGYFLRVQTNARSLVPRDGDTVDAILSQAEQALRDGNLQGALSQIDRLPDESREALGSWLDRARTRAAAESGIEDLANSVTSEG